MPADWTVRDSNVGIVFEGQKGTESYNATVQLELVDKEGLEGKSLNDVGEHVVTELRKKEGAAVERPTRHQTSGGRDAWMVKCRYTLRSEKGTVYPYRQVNVVVDYPGYYAGFGYHIVEPLFEKYVDPSSSSAAASGTRAVRAAPRANRAAVGGR